MQATLLPSAAKLVHCCAVLILTDPSLQVSKNQAFTSHHSHRIQLFITARRTVWASHGWTLLKPSWTSRKRSGFEKCCYPAYSPLLSLLKVKSVSLLKRIKETTDCVRLCRAFWRAKNCSLYVAFFFFLLHKLLVFRTAHTSLPHYICKGKKISKFLLNKGLHPQIFKLPNTILDNAQKINEFIYWWASCSVLNTRKVLHMKRCGARGRMQAYLSPAAKHTRGFWVQIPVLREVE